MNKKGMSLLEMVVAIFVISIASLMLFAGFSTVIRVFSEASENKNHSDDLLSYAERSDSGEIRNQVKSEKNANIYTIRVDGKNPIKVNGTFQLLNIKNNTDIYLKKLYNDQEQLIRNTEAYDNVKARVEDTLKAVNKFLKRVEGSDQYKFYPTNDLMKEFLFDTQLYDWREFPSDLLPSELKAKAQSKPFYMKVCFPWDYYTGRLNVVHDKMLIFLTQDNSAITSATPKANLSILYDYDSGSWYYYQGNKYSVSFDSSYLMDNIEHTFMSIDGDSYALGTSPQSWNRFIASIKAKNSGWRILDVNSTFNPEDPDTMWKAVS